MTERQREDNIAERIRTALIHAKINFSDLAKSLEVSRAAVSQWVHLDQERHVRPSDENLQKIANVTGVDRAWLSGESDENAPPPIEKRMLYRERFARRRQRRDVIETWLINGVTEDGANRLKRNFDQTLRINELDLHFGYASSKVIFNYQIVPADTLLRPSFLQNMLAPSLWNLAIAHQSDEDARNIDRRHIQFVIPDLFEPDDEELGGDFDDLSNEDQGRLIEQRMELTKKGEMSEHFTSLTKEARMLGVEMFLAAVPTSASQIVRRIEGVEATPSGIASLGRQPKLR